MSLPIFKDDNQNLVLMQNKWSSILNPVLANKSLKTSILVSVPLISGNNSINHMLGRKLQGWRIVRKRQFLSSGSPTSYEIYDIQDKNQKPNLTLNLTCDQGTPINPVIVDLEVF